MRTKATIVHLAFLLAEAAFLVLFLGSFDASVQGEGILAASACVASLCLLASVAILHVRFVRTSSTIRRQEVIHRQETIRQQEAALRSARVIAAPPAEDGSPAPDAHAAIEAADEAPPLPPAEPDELTTPEAASEAELAPAPEATPQVATPHHRSVLDFAALSDQLAQSSDPVAELKRFVGDVRTREAAAASTPTSPDDARDEGKAGQVTEAPSELERYAARMLEEAGLFSADVELPQITVVRPRASHMVYLRIGDPQIPYLAKLRVIRLEAALNAVRFACSSLDAATATQEDAYRLNQGLARSIVAQAAAIDEPLELEGVTRPDGEWAVRYGISQAVETLQLPYRLTTRFRTNVASGNVAIEFDLTPADAFPSSCFDDELGIVATTGDLRQRAAADYALRLALLLAASAFRCSERVRHVWVAAVHENATRRTCYLSVDFDRWRLSQLDLSDVGDLTETYRAFAPVLRYEDGWLRPVRQSFHLGEERFCPSERFMPVSLSSRRLAPAVADSLGTDHVSGLSIEEADNRTLVANAIMLRLAPPDCEDATQKNVRTVMELAGDDPDLTVRNAAERVISGLIDGTLDESPLAVGEEFVRGDALSRACERGRELLSQRRAADAQRVLEPVLAALDESGAYADTSAIVYRFFASYVDRTLYNRLYAPRDAGRTLILVPDAYYEAHLLLSIAHLAQGRRAEAQRHAERLVELSPLDTRSRLHLVGCLDENEREDEAISQLCALLEEAHDPQGIGMAYYRMAYFQWRRGNVVAAQACYACAMQFLPVAAPMVSMELSMLYLQNPDALSDELTGREIERTLMEHQIPVAPTQRTSELFYECAQASLDAEIFPVARNFASILGSFAGDDIIAGLVRSLEDAPDR